MLFDSQLTIYGKKCASNIIFCVAQKKAIIHTLITCIYASTKNIYIHGIFPFHKMLEKILLRTVHQTILWAPKNGSSVPLLWKKTFGPLVLFLKRCKSKWCQNVHVWVNVPCKRTLYDEISLCIRMNEETLACNFFRACCKKNRSWQAGAFGYMSGLVRISALFQVGAHLKQGPRFFS